jgi:hypothetical protein
MDIRDLAHALVLGDLLTARQWVADARRLNVDWETIPEPVDLSDRHAAIAAGMVELFAERTGAAPPEWTSKIGAVNELLILDPGLERMPRSFARAMASGPEALRKRNLVALPEFLEVA